MSYDDERKPAEMGMAPNWEKWLAMPRWTVREAVALSICLDPKHAMPIRGTDQITHMLNGATWCQLLEDRLLVVERASWNAPVSEADTEHLFVDRQFNDDVGDWELDFEEGLVSAVEFVKFFDRRGVSMPIRLFKFAKIRAPVDVSADDSEDVLVGPAGREIPDDTPLDELEGRFDAWPTYKAMPVWTIAEAAALSLRCDPTALVDVRWAAAPPRWFLEIESRYAERVQILSRALRIPKVAGGLASSAVDTSGLASEAVENLEVLRDDVLEYFRSHRVHLPNEIRESLGPLPQQHSWPWGSYSTPLLDELAQAVRQFWVEADLNNPPANKRVSAWLQDRGVDPTPADRIASLIRHPDAKEGRPTAKK